MGQSALAAAVPGSLFGVASPANAQTGNQPDWRFCAKCNGMFWNGTGDKGHCPAGGGHLALGWLFSLHFDAQKAGADKAQYDWRFCGKCHTLFFDGDPNKGRCPADNGGHLAQGFIFGLDFRAPAERNQKDWRFCSNCHVLFWNGSANKGRCPVGGGHRAQGLNFYVPFRDATADPGQAIEEAAEFVFETQRGQLEKAIKGYLGRGDLLGRGYTLHDMNFHFGQLHVAFNRPNFNITLNDNYLYTRVTQPTIFGSAADPAFELHFDGTITGVLVERPPAKPRVQNVIARVTSITVRPRDITGAIATTAVHFFQMTEAGGRLIQRFLDERLKVNLTNQINDYFARF